MPAIPKTPQKPKESKSGEVPATPKPSRDTATFTPYYWEAYNEIVQPRRFNHYLLTRWLPDLGAIGLAVVLVLRNRCYHNPDKGILRDSCEVRMEELAKVVGCSRATLFRIFKENEALQQFVQRIEQFNFAAGNPRQDVNRFRVCMDDPIHPVDMEQYELLRAEKEAERVVPARIVKRVESQSETQPLKTALLASHSETQQSQPETPNTESQIETPKKIDILSERLSKESLTPAAGIPPINPPEGEEAVAASVQRTTANEELLAVNTTLLVEATATHAEVWESVCRSLEKELPTHRYRLHFGGKNAITLKDMDDTTATLTGPVVLLDSARGKFNGCLQAAFAAVLGREVALVFTAAGG